MVFEILLPDLGEGTDEGSIVAWSKKVGDRVAAGDVLCEIEAGKAVVQVTSPGDGVLRAICRTEGDLLLSGTLLAVVADESDDIREILQGCGGG